MRIFIVDDNNLFLQGINALLSQHMPQASIECFSAKKDMYAALFDGPTVDLILADIHMPDATHITPMHFLAEHKLFIPVLLISATDGLGMIRHHLDAGAAGFVHKSSDSSKLLEAIDSVLSKGVYIDPTLNKKLSALSFHKKPLLSKRQSDVLFWLIKGQSNRGIAEKLGIAEATVKVHVSALFDIFGANSRLNCVRNAAALGFTG